MGFNSGVKGLTFPFSTARQLLMGIIEASQSHSVGLLCTGDRPVSETSTWQNKTLITENYATCGIWTCNPSKRGAADTRLRQRGPRVIVTSYNFTIIALLLIKYLRTEHKPSLSLPFFFLRTLRKRNGIVQPITGHESPKGEHRYRSTLSVTSALDRGGCSTPHPDRFTTGKGTGTRCIGVWVGFSADLDRCGKPRTHQNSSLGQFSR